MDLIAGGRGVDSNRAFSLYFYVPVVMHAVLKVTPNQRHAYQCACAAVRCAPEPIPTSCDCILFLFRQLGITDDVASLYNMLFSTARMTSKLLADIKSDTDNGAGGGSVVVNETPTVMQIYPTGSLADTFKTQIQQKWLEDGKCDHSASAIFPIVRLRRRPDRRRRRRRRRCRQCYDFHAAFLCQTRIHT